MSKIERRHCTINPFKPHPTWGHQPEKPKPVVQFRTIEGGAKLNPNGTVTYQGKLYPSQHAFRSLYFGGCSSDERYPKNEFWSDDQEEQDQDKGEQLSEEDVQESDSRSEVIQEVPVEIPEEEPPEVDALLKFYEDTLKESNEMIDVDWNILDEEDRKIVLETKAEMIQLRDARILELAEKAAVEPEVGEWEPLEDIDSSEESFCFESEPRLTSTIPVELNDDQTSQDTIGTEESRDSGCQLTDEVRDEFQEAAPATPVPEDMEVDDEGPTAGSEAAATPMEVEESQMFFETSTLDQTVVMKTTVEKTSSPFVTVNKEEQNGVEVTSEAKAEERQETCEPTSNGLPEAAGIWSLDAAEVALKLQQLKSEAQQSMISPMDTSAATEEELKDQLDVSELKSTAVYEENHPEKEMVPVIEKIPVVPEVINGLCSPPAEQIENEVLLPTNVPGFNLPVNNQSEAVVLLTEVQNGKQDPPQVPDSEDQSEEFTKPKQPKVPKLPTKLLVPTSTRILRSRKKFQNQNTEKASVAPVKKASTALPPSPTPQEMASPKVENLNESNGKKPVEPQASCSATASEPAGMRRVSVSDTKLEVLLRRAQLEEPGKSNTNNAVTNSTSPNDFLQTFLPPPANVAKSSMSSPALSWNFGNVQNGYIPSNAFSINVTPLYKKCMPSSGESCTPTAVKSSSVPQIVQTAAAGTPSRSKVVQ